MSSGMHWLTLTQTDTFWHHYMTKFTKWLVLQWLKKIRICSKVKHQYLWSHASKRMSLSSSSTDRYSENLSRYSWFYLGSQINEFLEITFWPFECCNSKSPARSSHIVKLHNPIWKFWIRIRIILKKKCWKKLLRSKMNGLWSWNYGLGAFFQETHKSQLNTLFPAFLFCVEILLEENFPFFMLFMLGDFLSLQIFLKGCDSLYYLFSNPKPIVILPKLFNGLNIRNYVKCKCFVVF